MRLTSKQIVERTHKVCIRGTFAYPLVIKSGVGCYLKDVDGRFYLDFASNVCSCNVGYNHPEIMKTIGKFVHIGAHKIAGQDFYSEEQVMLAEKLINITPSNLKKVFLINSGAEAVENAIKFAFRKKGPLQGVSCKNAFHGRTLGALSFTDSKAVQKINYPEINHDLIKFCTSDKDPEINELERLIEKEGLPAFVIVECIQGEGGGYAVASKKFIRNLRRTSKRHNFPLIFDEVQSGIGRTGKWWAFQHYGVKPDIMTSAKALQVGATITSKEYEPNEPGSVSSTWGGGHRIDMAVGLKTIEIIEKEKLMRNATKMGNYMTKRLRDIKSRNIVDVRGIGLMIGVELSSKEQQNAVVQKAFKKGLLLLGCGEKTVRMVPPLIINQKDADKGLDIFEKIVKSLK
ncbi:MAG: aspartate aminotransferase family protein [Candidatus Aenigmatarchaeota archaeon]